MDLEDYNIKEIDLAVIINELVTYMPNCIGEIYLFGSRAYKTNSTRSDIDLIILFKEKEDKLLLKVFSDTHNYLDFFIGTKEYIHSLVNDSTIKLKDGYVSLIEQLDAVLLWNEKNGFVKDNAAFFKQFIKKNVKWHPSSFESVDPIINLKKFIKNYATFISPRQLAFLKESIENYENENWLSFISMIGAYLETVFLDLISKYENRISIINASLLSNYHRDIGDTSALIGVKTRLEKFINFVNLNDTNFGKKYLDNKNIATFLETTFDIARRYRNSVDHCLEHDYDDDTCNQLVLLFNTNVQLIINAISLLNTNPSL